MKTFPRIVALSGLGLSLASAALAQQSERTQGIPGYLNPRTRTFHTKAATVSQDATAKTYTGTLKFVYTVQLNTAVTSSEVLVCAANAEVVDGTGTSFYEEGAAGTATVSGSTATCYVSIPYSWSLVDGSTDTVSLSYDLDILPTSASVLTAFGRRTHTSELASIPVPTTGATTTVPISATI